MKVYTKYSRHTHTHTRTDVAFCGFVLEEGRSGGRLDSLFETGDLNFGLLNEPVGGGGGLDMGTSESATFLGGVTPEPIGRLNIGLLKEELLGGGGGLVVGTSGSGTCNGGGGGTTTTSETIRE